MRAISQVSHKRVYTRELLIPYKLCLLRKTNYF